MYPHLADLEGGAPILPDGDTPSFSMEGGTPLPVLDGGTSCWDWMKVPPSGLAGMGYLPLLACSHCTELGMGPGMGTMGYYILCCTVHTVVGPGTGTGPGNATMGFGPIFPYLICVPVMRCN